MTSLESIDIGLFRFVNQGLSNPALDLLMPLFIGGSYVPLLLAACAAFLLWKGGTRGRVFLIFLAVLIFVGDNLVINLIKHAVDRPRPFAGLEDVILRAGRGGSGSMPSSHASTWFAATVISSVFYPRSWRFMLPLACTMAFSRVYLGVHYPSDVAAGAALGAGYAAFGLWVIHRTWLQTGPRWFPQWHAAMPSLLEPEKRPSSTPGPSAPDPRPDQAWTRLGYLLIGTTFVARLLYLAAGKIELGEDEAYQWIWSKYLALSYYSKPPLIAFTQFLGTSIWGDNAFGVRFFSPVLAAAMSVIILRFLSREVNPRAGFWLVATLHCAPLLGVGAILMTVDPLLVFFWTAAMLAGWRAVQASGRTRDWAWVGVWMGIAFLAKYASLYLLVCWSLFFLAWKPARIHLRKPGPCLALLINLLFTTPVLLWNAQHDWITVTHVATTNANLDKDWVLTHRYFTDFIATSAVLLNPIFFGALVWALIAIWRRPEKRPLELFLFCMGAPVFIGYWLYTLHSRVQPNWIAPAVLPMLALMVTYWDHRWETGTRSVKRWLIAGLALGAPVVLLLHDTNIVQKLSGRSLPARIDPLRRVRAWSETANIINQARHQLLSEGRDVFIICGHYGLVGEVSFYLPEARAALPRAPLVFSPLRQRPDNQFFFWPEFDYQQTRRGQNALFVHESKAATPPPQDLIDAFDSVTPLGLHPVKYRGRVFRQLQIFQCRNLK